MIILFIIILLIGCFKCIRKKKQVCQYFQFLACVSVATANLHTGFALGYSAILVPQLEKNKNEFVLTKSQFSWIGKDFNGN